MNDSIESGWQKELDSLQMPQNAYEIILGGLRDSLSEEALDLNGLDVTQQFSPYLKSLDAMESSAQHQFQYLKKQIPRIRFMQKQVGNVPRQITSAIESRMTNQWYKNLRRMLQLERERLTYMPPSSLAELPPVMKQDRAPSVRMSEFMIDNLSQHHRAHQENFAPAALQLLQKAISVLDSWCESLPQQPAHWALRPPLAMPGNDESTLMFTSATKGIQNPHLYMSSSNLRTQEFFTSHHMGSKLFGHYDPDDDSPAVLKFDYDDWMSSCSFGTIWVGQSKICLLPAGLPVQIVESRTHGLPLYISDRNDGSAILDQINLITNIRSFANYKKHVELEDASRPHNAVAAGRVLQLIAILCSILIAPQQWGKGIRKPSWVLSPVNGALVSHISLVAPLILDNLTESM